MNATTRSIEPVMCPWCLTRKKSRTSFDSQPSRSMFGRRVASRSAGQRAALFRERLREERACLLLSGAPFGSVESEHR
jgi:hypothetical protein